VVGVFGFRPLAAPAPTGARLRRRLPTRVEVFSLRRGHGRFGVRPIGTCLSRGVLAAGRRIFTPGGVGVFRPLAGVPAWFPAFGSGAGGSVTMRRKEDFHKTTKASKAGSGGSAGGVELLAAKRLPGVASPVDLDRLVRAGATDFTRA
jgi:hypothetical protein